ncbi:MAG: hypothetical protein JO122_05370 [Acetobacteraceae bacterium]|nr:hypothetical protein [Acetobacteraceae bacterium]
MQRFLLAVVAVLVVSAAGHSVSRGTSILFASNVQQMGAGEPAPTSAIAAPHKGSGTNHRDSILT